MTIAEATKKKILAAIAANRSNYPSDAKHATALGLSTSIYSMLKNGQTEKALSDANWLSIARKLNVALRNEIEWNAANRDLQVYHQANRVLSRLRAKQHSLRHPQHWKDLHSTLLCSRSQECSLYRLFASEDQVEVGSQDSIRVWCG